MSMAIRGAVAKQEVIDKILQVFPNAFVHDKTIRIPTIEDGQEIQIKLTLTAAKDLVAPNADKAIPAAVLPPKQPIGVVSAEAIQPTSEEKANVERFLKAVGKI